MTNIKGFPLRSFRGYKKMGVLLPRSAYLKSFRVSSA